MIYGNQHGQDIEQPLWERLLARFFGRVSEQSSDNIALVAQAMHQHQQNSPAQHLQHYWHTMAAHFLLHHSTYHRKYRLIMLAHLQHNLLVLYDILDQNTLDQHMNSELR